ncbi:MAG: ABC transporter substrate-binding protein [Desulfobacterales bacterium]|jgi:branched-chain amino acid transport system substrate-binding protein
MMKKNIFIAMLVGLFTISLILMPAHAQAKNIKVGVIDCYSGPPALFGKDALNGFKLALNEINAKGVLGKKIEFTTRDTKFKVDLALNFAKELVLRENVDILVGTINSGAALAVSEAVAKREKVPFIAWISKSENITGKKGHRYVFSAGENTAMAGKSGGVALSTKPFVKYWIAGDDYEYGHAIADAAWRNLKAKKPGVQLIGKSWWKPGEPDLIPYITSILAAKPDAVIFATGGASMANIMKAVKATGMAEKVGIYIHSAIDYAVLKPLGINAPEGVMGTIDYLFYYPEISANKSFVNAFKKAYGHPPGFPAFQGYITAHFIAEAYKKAGSLDTEKFIDALEGLQIQSPAGRIEMRACDHQAILPMNFGVTKVSPELGFAVATDIYTLRGAEVMPSCQEIMDARGQ